MFSGAGRASRDWTEALMMARRSAAVSSGACAGPGHDLSGAIGGAYPVEELSIPLSLGVSGWRPLRLQKKTRRRNCQICGRARYTSTETRICSTMACGISMGALYISNISVSMFSWVAVLTSGLRSSWMRDLDSGRVDS